MGVSRSGYYKWKKRDRTDQTAKRTQVIELVKEVHEAHKVHGYRWVCAFIRINYQITFSENYVYKAFKYLGIKAETRHQIHYKPRKEKDKYPNLIFSTWETVDRPRQVIVSDMTAFHSGFYSYYELTMYFDVFTKQILSYRLARRRGDREQYIEALEDVIALLEGNTEPAIIHTDQGSVYASMAYNDLIKDKNIVRSMSRAGKPTDNPVNESLNGWIKEELFMDFRLNECIGRDQIIEVVERYILYYNSQRPSYALGYDTPDHYYERYMNGELEHRNTFKDRVLTETPKFVQKRLVSSSEKGNEEKES